VLVLGRFIKMEYDAMMMDGESLGPSVKISAVGLGRCRFVAIRVADDFTSSKMNLTVASIPAGR
jgi:hypothetical protein